MEAVIKEIPDLCIVMDWTGEGEQTGIVCSDCAYQLPDPGYTLELWRGEEIRQTQTIKNHEYSTLDTESMAIRSFLDLAECSAPSGRLRFRDLDNRSTDGSQGPGQSRVVCSDVRRWLYCINHPQPLPDWRLNLCGRIE